jgi:hypothetical protein
MGVIGDEPQDFTIRRALNMNVDLDGIKAKMAKELEEIAAREVTLQQQMSHLEAVLQLAGSNGDSAVMSDSTQSTVSEYSEDSE